MLLHFISEIQFKNVYIIDFIRPENRNHSSQSKHYITYNKSDSKNRINSYKNIPEFLALNLHFSHLRKIFTILKNNQMLVINKKEQERCYKQGNKKPTKKCNSA